MDKMFKPIDAELYNILYLRDKWSAFLGFMAGLLLFDDSCLIINYKLRLFAPVSGFLKIRIPEFAI
jgi:hypothetical protein